MIYLYKYNFCEKISNFNSYVFFHFPSDLKKNDSEKSVAELSCFNIRSMLISFIKIRQIVQQP